MGLLTSKRARLRSRGKVKALLAKGPNYRSMAGRLANSLCLRTHDRRFVGLPPQSRRIVRAPKPATKHHPMELFRFMQEVRASGI
jgi:hypothetical protein